MVFVWWETNTHGWEYRVRVFNGLIPRRATAARCNGVNGLRSVQISGCWLRTGCPPATWKPGNLHPPPANWTPFLQERELFATRKPLKRKDRNSAELALVAPDPRKHVSTNVYRGAALPLFGGFWFGSVWSPVYGGQSVSLIAVCGACRYRPRDFDPLRQVGQ